MAKTVNKWLYFRYGCSGFLKPIKPFKKGLTRVDFIIGLDNIKEGGREQLECFKEHFQSYHNKQNRNCIREPVNYSSELGFKCRGSSSISATSTIDSEMLSQEMMQQLFYFSWQSEFYTSTDFQFESSFIPFGKKYALKKRILLNLHAKVWPDRELKWIFVFKALMRFLRVGATLSFTVLFLRELRRQSFYLGPKWWSCSR